MFARILVAIDDFSQSQAVIDLAKDAATEGVSEVRALHLRLREVSGFAWYTRESRKDAAFVAEAATFELRMAGLSAGGGVRYAADGLVALRSNDEIGQTLPDFRDREKALAQPVIGTIFGSLARDHGQSQIAFAPQMRWFRRCGLHMKRLACEWQ